MQQNSNTLSTLFPESLDLDQFRQIHPMPILSGESIAFFNALSGILTRDPAIREFPDVATFAFFCRKSHLVQLRERYAAELNNRLGRGLVFHVSPSNVPVNFAYSLLAGVLAGNTNVVRVPSRNFEQIDLITKAINKIAHDDPGNPVTKRLALVRYDKQSDFTKLFSSVADARVIWGGDATIAQIRNAAIPPRAFDVTFADRYSFCVINADQYVEEQNPHKIAQGFYNDTYLFDQNACTAPHLVVWLGSASNVQKSKETFWDHLHTVVKEKRYQVQAVIAVDKLSTLFAQAVQTNALFKPLSPDNLLWRVELSDLSGNIDEFRCSSGYFCEYHATSLQDLTAVINRKYQTMAYYGFDKEVLFRFINGNAPFGIDRVVPIGQTSDFSLFWDGYDLIRTLSRYCQISARNSEPS